MTNVIILSFTTLFLVTQNILLLNEESLILLCFIVFVILGLNNLSVPSYTFFKTQSIQIENGLKTSLKQILQLLNKYTIFKISSSEILSNFLFLKRYYIEFGNLFINFLPQYNKTILKTSYQKRLVFLGKIEEQTTKLLTVVLIKRLNKIIKTKRFYKQIVVTPQFLCLETICLRECVQLIGIKS